MPNQIPSPLVTVVCTVFNHGKYLKSCLDGFVMQKTDFPFIVLVHDDCSTDDSVRIIKEYADKYPNIIQGKNYTLTFMKANLQVTR